MSTPSKYTPLHAAHVAAGARLVDFAGWELQVQYPTGPLEEHKRVREAAGLFDIDHMGQVVVAGPDALSFLQKIQVNDISTMAIKVGMVTSMPSLKMWWMPREPYPRLRTYGMPAQAQA